MAKCTVKMPDDFLLKLSKLGNKTDEIAEKVLEAGGQVILDKTRTNLESVVGKGTKTESRSTGELVNSLGLSPVRRDKNGDSNIKLGFSEQRKDGKSNAMVANILEYGKSGQPAKPFLKPAKNATKNQVKETMIETLEEEIKKL